MAWDASIDLLDSHFLIGSTQSDGEAADLVRAAVGAIPGAKYLSLEVHQRRAGQSSVTAALQSWQ
jgi:hypothetical protein